MTDEEKAEEYADKILFDSKYPFIFNKEKVKAYIIKVYLDSLKCCEEAYNKGLAKGRKELKEKISVLLSCTNCPENKGGWICEKEYEGRCLSQKVMYIKELKAEMKEQLTKAKELLTKWVELFKPKGGNIPPTPIQVETEQFIREVEE